jgi:hypothetical protein
VAPILSQINPFHTSLPPYFPVIPIVILSSYLRLNLPLDLFTSGFPTKILYAFLISPLRATWKTISCRLSMSAHALYSQLPSISGGRILHPQPEDAPYCGDRAPRNMALSLSFSHLSLVSFCPILNLTSYPGRYFRTFLFTPRETLKADEVDLSAVSSVSPVLTACRCLNRVTSMYVTYSSHSYTLCFCACFCIHAHYLHRVRTINS